MIPFFKKTKKQNSAPRQDEFKDCKVMIVDKKKDNGVTFYQVAWKKQYEIGEYELQWRTIPQLQDYHMIQVAIFEKRFRELQQRKQAQFQHTKKRLKEIQQFIQDHNSSILQFQDKVRVDWDHSTEKQIIYEYTDSKGIKKIVTRAEMMQINLSLLTCYLQGFLFQRQSFGFEGK